MSVGNDFNLMSNLITDATRSFAAEIRKTVAGRKQIENQGGKISGCVKKT